MTDAQVFVGVSKGKADTMGGIFRRNALGEGRWERLGKGLPDEVDVHAITVHPGDLDTIFIGTKDGIYRSGDRGGRWERVGLPERGVGVWAITVHPTNPKLLYAGTSPAAVWRSEDGGDNWRKLPQPPIPNRVQMGFDCRVMRLAADPNRPDEVYATLEVNGAMRSLDAGEHWEDCSTDLIKLAERPHLKSRILSDTETEGMLDGHALTVSAAAPGTVYLAVRMGLFKSADRGQSWQDMEIGRFSPLTYARDVRTAPQDPRTLYACLSPAARSTDGSVWKSEDLGQSWRRLDHGIKANSTMMAVALHQRDPGLVCAVSRHGQVFATGDGGKSWQETALPAGCQDVYAAACA